MYDRSNLQLRFFLVFVFLYEGGGGGRWGAGEQRWTLRATKRPEPNFSFKQTIQTSDPFMLMKQRQRILMIIFTPNRSINRSSWNIRMNIYCKSSHVLYCNYHWSLNFCYKTVSHARRQATPFCSLCFFKQVCSSDLPLSFLFSSGTEVVYY